ncbi:MAG: DUF167 domain-containing protein [candidate division KSB1 bacterium]|nr:DUF167 domain-containing protein [candidate division KSB1 bacterium]
MKIIEVKVIPNARKNQVSEEGRGLKVHVKAPAVGGKANKAVIEVLADFFKVNQSAIKIIRGQKSRKKVVEVDDGAGG